MAVNNIQALKQVFSSFLLFAVSAIAVGVPLSVLAGYIHFKRSLAFSAEVDIGVEANPYYFKVTPGKEREIQGPLAIANIDLSLAMAAKLGVLTPEVELEYLRAREKYVRLLKHGDYRISDSKSPSNN